MSPPTNQSVNEASDIRTNVSKAYAEALKRSQAEWTSCCGGPTECAPAGSAAQTAGYDQELRDHGEAGASSFGCGNPLAFAGVQPGDTVLDLGSGAGFDLLIASDVVGPEGRVIGVDMTDEMLAAARANAERAGKLNIELRKGTIEKLPVDDASVDWVISNCVINLSPEKERVFAEIARVLKPGGHFSISDITAERIPEGLLAHPAAHCACVSGAISQGDYIAGLQQAGLVRVEVAERSLYGTEQLLDMIAKDFEWAQEDTAGLAEALTGLEGQVASVRLTGMRSAPCC